MRKLWGGLLLGLLAVATLSLSVFSQTGQTSDATVAQEIQILQSEITHSLPVSVTVVLPTESGSQTVTVPLMLNLNLSIGPVEALDLSVEVEQAQQFVSPLAPAVPVTTTEPVTTTGN
jgi:hypothetical protein